MNWMKTDQVSALQEIRKLINIRYIGKESCLEWRWTDGKAEYHRRQDDQTVFGHTPVHSQFISGEAEYSYLLHEAPGGTRGKPLILFLHGFGERGGDIRNILEFGPFRFLSHGGNLQATVVAPHLEENRHWVENSSGDESDTEMIRLESFVQQMISRYRPDPGRISCTGLSMGGRGTYRLVCRLPEMFSSLSVCCGRAGDEYGITVPLDRLANQRIWIFHGMQDHVVPPLRAIEALEALLQAQPKGNYRLTLYPFVGHECYEKAYLNGEMYRWLTDQPAQGRRKRP